MSTNRASALSRRGFIAGATAAGVLTAMPGIAAAKGEPFKLKYAPRANHFLHSAGDDIVDQIEFAADVGFRAWEDNFVKRREVAEQERMAAAMARRNVQMGVFIGTSINWDVPTITSGDVESRAKFLSEIRESIEVAKRVNAKWMTIIPGHVNLKIKPFYQMANVVETLKQASALLEPHGLVMVLEPLNFLDSPGMFLTEVPQAYAVCKAVDSPSCKILFDLYHQQITEGNLIPNIDDAWEEIAYFQVGDVPGRKEPTTGEINYRNVFRHIYKKGFDGVVGMEHGKSIDGIEGEKALIEAYRKSDDFEA